MLPLVIVTFLTAVIVSALISLLFLPPLFGIIAIACGVYILSKSVDGGQKQHGGFVIILGVICMIIGFILSAASVLS
jgi:hypothetical protein